MKKIPFTILSFLLYCIFYSFLVNGGDSTNKKEKLINAFVKEIKKEEIYDEYNYPAVIRPEIMADIITETEGRVEKILLKEGDRVNKNQKIVYLKNTNPAYQYKKIYIKAPFSGVIDTVFVSKGTQVLKGEKVLSIQDPESLIIKIEIPAGDLSTIALGKKGILTFRGKNDQFQVEVERIKPRVDVITGTATAYLKILSTKKKLKGKLFAGMLGKVQFKSNQRMGFLLPRKSLNFKGKNIFIHYIEDNKVKSSIIGLGPIVDGAYEILSGIPEGKYVVIKSTGHLVDGEKVKMIKITDESKKDKL